MYGFSLSVCYCLCYVISVYLYLVALDRDDSILFEFEVKFISWICIKRAARRDTWTMDEWRELLFDVINWSTKLNEWRHLQWRGGKQRDLTVGIFLVFILYSYSWFILWFWFHRIEQNFLILPHQSHDPPYQSAIPAIELTLLPCFDMISPPVFNRYTPILFLL